MKKYRFLSLLSALMLAFCILTATASAEQNSSTGTTSATIGDTMLLFQVEGSSNGLTEARPDQPYYTLSGEHEFIAFVDITLYADALGEQANDFENWSLELSLKRYSTQNGNTLTAKIHNAEQRIYYHGMCYFQTEGELEFEPVPDSVVILTDTKPEDNDSIVGEFTTSEDLLKYHVDLAPQLLSSNKAGDAYNIIVQFHLKTAAVTPATEPVPSVSIPDKTPGSVNALQESRPDNGPGSVDTRESLGPDDYKVNANHALTILTESNPGRDTTSNESNTAISKIAVFLIGAMFGALFVTTCMILKRVNAMHSLLEDHLSEHKDDNSEES